MLIVIRVTRQPKYVSAYDGVARTWKLDREPIEPEQTCTISIATRTGIGDLTVYAGFSRAALEPVYRNSSLTKDCTITLDQLRENSHPGVDLPDCTALGVGRIREGAGKDDNLAENAAA